MEATRNKGIFKGLSKTRRARYSFIIAQLSERQGDLKRAREYYDRTVRLKPAYEMIFYSKIKIARLFDIKNNNTVKLKKDLLKMSREFKNTDYNDVIFFTLGEIEEKEKNIPQALSYYNQSVRKSVNNPNQKALSFLKMAEINFDLTNYQPAEAYYDSTIAALSPDHPDYNNIIARKKTLETLVKQIKTISREDSLQRIAKMSETDRNKFIDRLIEQLEKEEARRLRDLENAQNNAASSTNTLGSSGGASPLPGMGSSATFYFYSPTLVSFGIVDYVKKWGNRKQEDNWRRSGKALLMDEQTADGGRRDSAGVTKVDSIKKMKLGRDFYLKDLPMNDTLLTKSTNRIIKAYYVMGSVYKEELNNTKKTISTFEELNIRYPENRYALNTYYSLYRIYLQEKNTSKAEYYKNKILTEFPESEFAMLIKNPDYAQERNAQKSEVEDFYSQVLADYRSANFQEALSKSKKGISAYGKSDYLSKFEFIKAVSAGKLKGVDTLEKELKLLVAKYPDSEVTPLSQDILNSIKKQKNPILQQARELARTKADSFHVNAALPHFIIAFLPDDTKLVDAFKTNVANFNTIYYNSQTFDISSTLFEKQQFVLIKSFADAKEVISYHESLCADADTYKGLKKENVEIFPISSENLPILYKSKNLEGYRAFYIAQYQGNAKKN
jgi:tetratricopeptide (TPR) repeat protein